MGFNLSKCNICGSQDLKKVMNETIYGKRYGHGKTIQCNDCKHFVGCHDDWRPLGLISNRAMKDMKIKCHELFDKSWKSGKLTRGEAYTKLAERLNISYEDCHFGYFDLDMLHKVYKILNKEWR